MKIDVDPTGATPEELLEIIHGLLIVIEKHKLYDLVKAIKDDVGGFNLLDRIDEILAKCYPEVNKNQMPLDLD